MNCLVVTPHRYGIVEMAERVGTEWEAMGHDVDYITPKGDAARVGPVTVGISGIAVWWYRTLRRLAREGAEYDLIWTHQPVAPALPTTDPEFWERVLVTFHTTEYREYQLAKEGVYPAVRRPYLWLTSRLERRFYRKLTALPTQPTYTVVSPHLREEVATFGVEDAAYVPNGVFTPDDEEFEPIRGQYGIPEDATLVFNIGSLTPQKRPDLLAELMAGATADREDIYCVIAGKGPLRDAVAEHTGEQVRAVGYVSEEEKWRWFADADVFPSMSAYEGMPVATMEALSFGLPVVLSDIPSHRHLRESYPDSVGVVRARSSALVAAIVDASDGEAATVDPDRWSDAASRYLEVAGHRRSIH